MSGIAGTVSPDGRPADRAVLERMLGTMAHRGPDGVDSWTAGPVALGHLMLRTTAESLREKQPLADEADTLCLTLDGRVDNRAELRAALEAKGACLRADTDAELVLRAFQCWGEDSPARIIGDFAFAVWNARDRSLFCARDPFGIRALYYVFDGRTFCFSSELRPLLETPGFVPRPNLGMLGEHLCDNVTSQSETLYQGIVRLPPAHRLTLRGGRLRQTRYFEFDPRRTVRHGSDAEYAEHFFEVFREAVDCRMRSHTPVSLFVSGGVDSSSILGMAHNLVRQGRVAHNRLAVYSLLSGHPHADERSYLEDAVGTWGGRAQCANMDAVVAPPLAEQVGLFRDFPDYPNGSAWQPLYDLANAAGSRVNIWGFGGDEWLAGDRAHCADLLLQLKLATLARQIRFDIAQSNVWGSRRFSYRDAVRWCVFPLVPHALKTMIKRRRQSDVPRWITTDFAKRIGLQDRLLSAPPPPFPDRAQQAIAALLQGGGDAFSNEMQDRFNAHRGMEGRYPFYDRRLVEFALALPEEQRWRDDSPKFVLRNAMRGLLPESVLQRKSKAEFSHLFMNAIARESAEETFRSLRLCEHGYVDADVARELHERCKHGDRLPMGPVWTILALEYWYRAALPGIA